MSRNLLRSNKVTTKQESIAFRLAGKVKNFTGRGPVVIKVNIEEQLVTVHLKWALTRPEKKYLDNCEDTEIVNEMRNKLVEEAKERFCRAFSEVVDCEVDIIEVNEESLQEKLVLHARVYDLAS